MVMKQGSMKREAFLIRGAAALLSAIGSAGVSLATPRPSDALDYRTLSEDQWRKRLTPAQFVVLRKQGTEWAFSSPLDHEKRSGLYSCAGCDLPLFSSKTKFDSGTGWPSFWAPLPNAVATTTDNSLFEVRTEAHGSALLHERRRADVQTEPGLKPRHYIFLLRLAVQFDEPIAVRFDCDRERAQALAAGRCALFPPVAFAVVDARLVRGVCLDDPTDVQRHGGSLRADVAHEDRDATAAPERDDGGAFRKSRDPTRNVFLIRLREMLRLDLRGGVDMEAPGLTHRKIRKLGAVIREASQRDPLPRRRDQRIHGRFAGREHEAAHALDGST